MINVDGVESWLKKRPFCDHKKILELQRWEVHVKSVIHIGGDVKCKVINDVVLCNLFAVPHRTTPNYADHHEKIEYQALYRNIFVENYEKPFNSISNKLQVMAKAASDVWRLTPTLRSGLIKSIYLALAMMQIINSSNKI